MKSPRLDSVTSRYYEECWATGGEYAQFSQVTLDPLIRHLAETCLPPGGYCLDVGCGDGKTAGTWLTTLNSRYVGVDIAESAVRRARELGLDARVIEDAANLPFPDGTFDLVVCTEVLEHVFQPQLVAEEILRVLRPGAMFIATVPNVTHWRHRLSFCFAGRWDPYGCALSVERPWSDPHIRFFTKETLERMLTLVGFEGAQIRGSIPKRIRGLPWVDQKLVGFGSLGWLPVLVSRRLVAAARKPNVTSEPC